MRLKFLSLALALMPWLATTATTITVVPIYEPLSLHGTDGDEAISDSGEALQATVMPRPMALSGAFPEDLVQAIRTPHLLPTNNENYKVQEANLLVLCNIGLTADIEKDVLTIHINVAEHTIPADVDLTSRQILKLTIVAIRKTLEEWHIGQGGTLKVVIHIDENPETASKTNLAELSTEFDIGEVPE